MFEFTQEMDNKAIHTALKMRNNVLPVKTWADALGLDLAMLEGLPSPVSYGRLKFMLTSVSQPATLVV